MSDYMFMLENHLNADQVRVVGEVQAWAAEANAPVYLTGGALRDMLGGYPTRDLDFTVETNPVKLAKALAERLHARSFTVDETRKRVDLVLPGGVTAEVSMARTEKYPKPGAKPQVEPANIYEDLRRRDFTVNSIALSLNRASRGLLLDPNMGQSDIEHRELRAPASMAFYDDPVRMLRLIRLKVRLGYAVAERTQTQYQNAREAGVEKYITAKSLWDELKAIAGEPNPVDVLMALDQEGLLKLFHESLTGPKLNQGGFAKLQKAKQYLPFGIDLQINHLTLFLSLVTEKLTPKERAALVEALKMEPEEVQNWHKLETRAKKVETELKSPKLQKPSQMWRALAGVPGEQIVYLLMRSEARIVQDRLKNYLQKHLPMTLEVTDKDVEAAGFAPGTPKFAKKKDELIAQRLDARPKKVPAPDAAPAPAGTPSGAPPAAGAGSGGASPRANK